MNQPLYALQYAVYQRLSNDSELSALITGVYDNVPENTAFPYVTIGDDQADEWDTFDSDGSEIDMHVHCWDQGRGRARIKQIMQIVHRLLNRHDLDLDGHTVVLMREDFSNTMIDPDGVTYHGTQRFRVLTEEA